jgi:SAM-dependent methyltransferase
MDLRHLCKIGTGKYSHVRFYTVLCLAGLLLWLRANFSRECGPNSFYWSGTFHTRSQLWKNAMHLSEYPEPCPAYIFAGIYPLETHAYTNRSFNHHMYMHPPFLNFSHKMESKPFAKVLELGSGSGRALIELQSKFGDSECYGTNYGGYKLPQARSQFDLLSAVRTYNLTIFCRNDEPILPKIILTPSIIEFNLTSKFDQKLFDFIISVHALNNKLPWNMSHTYVPDILNLLAPAGLAILHVGDLNSFFQPNENAFAITHSFCLMHTVQNKKKRFSAVLYVTGKIGHVGMMLRHCMQTDLSNALGDCIVPNMHARKFFLEPAELKRKEVYMREEMDKTKKQHLLDAFKTWKNLVNNLQHWEDWN